MRPSRVVISLAALQENYAHAKTVHGSRVFAVLKADAYGHGSKACARALTGVADGFAVAFVEEALSLRTAGIQEPILVLEGAFDRADLQAAIDSDLWLVVHQEAQLRMLEELDTDRQVSVWLKVDSGMHRAGVACAQVQTFWQRLQECKGVKQTSLMTHFSSADERSNNATRLQLANFEEATRGLTGQRSISNSAGILGWPSSHSDWGRAGLMLYGVDPTNSGLHKLKPVMTLMSTVFAERIVQSGESVGYGDAFVAKRPTRVGLVALGYADGYPRTAPSGTPVSVGGYLTQTVGRVSMDMLAVDLTELPTEGMGSSVELWGSQVPVETVADVAGTIAYELLCRVKRVPVVYQ